MLAELVVIFDEGNALLDTGGGAESVGRRVFHIVEQAVDAAGCDMEARIGGGVVDEHRAIRFSDPSVRENDIRDISDAFGTFWRDEVTAGFGDDFGGVLEVGEEEVKDIAETCGGVADTVSEVEPAFLGFDRSGALSVFEFVNGVVSPAVDDGFGAGDRIFHGIAESPADAAAGTRVDKPVLRARVEGVFATDKFGVKNDIPLLRGRRFDVGEAFPRDEVFRAHETGLGGGGRLVGSGGCVVAALGAEDAVDPAVFVFDEAHIIDIGIGVVRFGNDARFFPESESFDTVGAFRHGEKAFAVPAFDADAEEDFTVAFDGTGVEGGVDAHAFEEEWVGGRVEVVAPFEGHMTRGDGGV